MRHAVRKRNELNEKRHRQSLERCVLVAVVVGDKNKLVGVSGIYISIYTIITSYEN